MVAPNRVVTALTPVFAALAGWVCQLAATHLPGHPHLSSGELTAVFVTGAVSASGAALKWLHGWAAHERFIADPQFFPPDPPVPVRLRNRSSARHQAA